MSVLDLIKVFRGEVEDLFRKVGNYFYFNNGTPYNDEGTEFVDEGEPYESTEQVLEMIPASMRKKYLTVNIQGVEYWFLPDGSLVPKVGDMAIADRSITLAKLADMPSGSLYYRKSAGAGPPETQTLATLRTDLNIPAAYVIPEGYSLIPTAALADLHAPMSDNQTLDDLEGVKRPEQPVIDEVPQPATAENAVAVFVGTDGKEIKGSSATIDDLGNLKNVAAPDEEGFAIGGDFHASGDNSYGTIGNAKSIPVLGKSTDPSQTGIRTGIAVESINEGTEVDFGMAYDFFMPWNGDNLNILAGRVVCLWSDVTAGAENSRFEFWLKKGGVLTKVATIDHNGVITNTGGYKETKPYQFTSDGSEVVGALSVVQIDDMKGTEIVQITRGIQPLSPIALPSVPSEPTQYTFDPALGRTIVTALSPGETLYFIYNKIVQ